MVRGVVNKYAAQVTVKVETGAVKKNNNDCRSILLLLEPAWGAQTELCAVLNGIGGLRPPKSTEFYLFHRCDLNDSHLQNEANNHFLVHSARSSAIGTAENCHL